jgi:hypothetical protein
MYLRATRDCAAILALLESVLTSAATEPAEAHDEPEADPTDAAKTRSKLVV